MSQGTRQSDSGDVPPTDASKVNTDTTRRRLLATGAATWATVGLAGCLGDDDDENGDDGEAGDGQDGDSEPQAENYVVTAETWSGGGVPAAISFMSSCARSDTFVPGMDLVFFVGIFDPETGDRVTDEDLGGVQVDLGDGMETIDLSWTDENAHATRNEGNNWVGSWSIPDDMDPQSFAYAVEVSDGDANFQNVGVLTDSIEVVEYDSPTNFVVDTETRWNGHPAPEYTNGFVGACAPEREFTPELDVTFVVGIYDSTSGHMVGNEGLVDRTTGELVEDESSEVADGLDSATVLSADGSFDDLELAWEAGVDDENTAPGWRATLETEDLDPGTYGYEVEISDESIDQFNTGIASAQFSIIEVPE